MAVKPCPRCRKMIPQGMDYCPDCKPIAMQQLQEYRKQNAARRQQKYNRKRDSRYLCFYRSKDWRRTSRAKLQACCYKCEAKLEGCTGLAVEVHHVKPIQTPEGWELRLEWSNLEALCTHCHNMRHPEKLQTCLEELVYAIAFYQEMTHSGYTFACTVNDSILTDSAEERKQDMHREENTPVYYDPTGRAYTKYEALQRQRRLERSMRAQRQSIRLLEEGDADENDILAARARYRGTSQEYTAFSEAMGLPQQRERVTVDGAGNNLHRKHRKQLTNAVGKAIIRVERNLLTGEPNSITQKENSKGGIERNYYGPNRKEFKQISNNDHGKPKQHPFGKHGEHAHDYIYDEDGNLIGRPARELTDEERKENADIL